MNKLKKNIGIGLLVLALISPIGILLPKWLHAGDAGEKANRQSKKGYWICTKGMKKNAGIWKAPMPDYSNGKENNSLLSGLLLPSFRFCR